jgi:hypothetical protein
VIAEGPMSERLVQEALGTRVLFVLVNDDGELVFVGDTVAQLVEQWPTGDAMHVRALVGDRFYPLRERELKEVVRLLQAKE